MNTLLLRRLRGAIGIGLLWALGWIVVISGIILVVGIFDPDSIDPGERWFEIAPIVGTVGFFSGIAFGILFSLLENRKKILELSPLRAAVWGALGGAVLPLLTPVNDQLLWNTCPLGALFAAASVAVARRAELRSPASPDLPHSDEPSIPLP